MQRKQKIQSPTTPDQNQVAYNIVAQATKGPNMSRPPHFAAIVSQVMSEMGRKGGLKGGKARAASLSAAERTAIAKKAALSRWKKP